jgi:hypothetical protein
MVEEPIELPSGQRILTLHDAATYATKLAKTESAAAEWQAAIEALILVADLGGPTMLTRIGVMRALNRHVERVFDPSRKDKHWGKRKLARDRLRKQAVIATSDYLGGRSSPASHAAIDGSFSGSI